MAIKKEVTKKIEECCAHQYGKSYGGSSSSAVYGIGIFGAAFYFIPQAVGFTGFIMAVLKSLVWPALLVYQALSLLKL